MARATKKKRLRLRFDSDGNVVGAYVPLKDQTKKQQQRASKRKVAACSAGATARGSSARRVCGPKGLRTASRAQRGRAYIRYGFPKGWPKEQYKNPIEIDRYNAFGFDIEIAAFEHAGETVFVWRVLDRQGCVLKEGVEEEQGEARVEAEKAAKKRERRRVVGNAKKKKPAAKKNPGRMPARFMRL